MEKKILILSPHTDDAEIGCGATISKLITQGHEIYYAVFSSCDESLPIGFQKGSLIKEMYKASSVLGVKKENIKLYDYKVRYFSNSRQDILDKMVQLNKDLNPDIIFIPSINDVHQDHKVIYEEGIRAFKKKTLLAYEMPWNNLDFKNQYFSIVDNIALEKKTKAINEYKTQLGRPYTSAEFIESQLVYHGTKVGFKYAELFEVVRIISV